MIHGEVTHGEGRGAGMSLPTLNLPNKPDLPYGVYAVWVEFDDEKYKGAMNWGPRPSFDEEEPVLEVHILDFEGDLYGKRVGIEPVKKLREIKKFDSKDDLITQIKADVEQVRQHLL